MQVGHLRWFGLTCLALPGLFACASGWGETPLETAHVEERAVVTLQARDAEVTISSTARGVRYSVRDDRGVSESALTLQQLQALDPHLFELVQQATASRWFGGASGGVLDASRGALPARSQPGALPGMGSLRR
jgi:hypothetical protein